MSSRYDAQNPFALNSFRTDQSAILSFRRDGTQNTNILRVPRKTIHIFDNNQPASSLHLTFRQQNINIVNLFNDIVIFDNFHKWY